MNRLDAVEKTQMRESIPTFQPGDTVRVHVRIKESETKERLQAFEGVVIARKHGGVRETITVRKTSFGVGVERIFPLHATIVDHIDVIKLGRVRRAKLYYLRELRGKAARIRERDTREKIRIQNAQPDQSDCAKSRRNLSPINQAAFSRRYNARRSCAAKETARETTRTRSTTEDAGESEQARLRTGRPKCSPAPNLVDPTDESL